MTAVHALWLWLALDGTPVVPAAAPPGPAGVAGPGLFAEVQGGVNAPLGPLGFALVQPIWRLGIGAGVGMDLTTETVFVPRSRRRGAVFARVQLVDGAHFRLALGVGLSNQTDYVQHLEGDRLVTWQRQGQRRHDATVAAEVPVGPVWVGLAAGVGWVSGTISCMAQDLTVHQELGCTSADGSPPTGIPFAALSLRHRASLLARAGDRGAGAVAGSAPPGPASPTNRELRLFLAGSTVGDLQLFLESDGYVPSTDYSAGLEGELLWRRSAYLRLGLGLRYELAYGNQRLYEHPITDHFLYLPFLIGLPFPTAGGCELELQLGLGLALGLIQTSTAASSSNYEQGIGPLFEFSVNYWTPITASLDLSIGAAGRAAVLAGDTKSILPLRVGLRWGV
jgi:hypothetical protein